MRSTSNFKLTFFLFTIIFAICYFISTGSIFPKTTHAPEQVYRSIQSLELADTPQNLAHGLMFRENLCDGCGMLFVFTPDRQIHMWMKNTPSSLDMIFINKHGYILGIFENTVPFQESPAYTIRKKTKYVLEMKAGFVKKVGLERGMKLNMEKLMALIKNT